MESDLFPDLIEDYDDYHAHTETGHLVRGSLIRDWIERRANVLDAGCGDGVIAEYVARELDARVEGLDVSPVAVEKARSRGIPARVHDLDAEPQLPSGFDYILLIEVLEHLRWPHRVLTEAASKARKAVIVTIPNSAWIGYRLQMVAGHAPVQSFTHLHLWSHRDFTAFVRKLGLPKPDSRFLSSRGPVRKALTACWPNLLAHQLAYRIVTRDEKDRPIPQHSGTRRDTSGQVERTSDLQKSPESGEPEREAQKTSVRVSSRTEIGNHGLRCR